MQVFVRHGKRLIAITEPGKAVVAIAERMLAEAQNMKRAGEEFANDQLGTLTIAATHTQARYALPKAVAASKQAFTTSRSHAEACSSPCWRIQVRNSAASIVWSAARPHASAPPNVQAWAKNARAATTSSRLLAA